ncbi:bifunctional metallophosphatase/5'-nucleotidase [Paenibacillus apiarius]|uniref:Bifunctional metallophosphatase/5'-nucleotidase n=1 Tax=Paenibacillus apiarius TaxID=46240 RepID=A0ABT4DU79_9BACL|nr:bifunctional UDP-sugar hydrolase/5'-nucleotidase [Paenibacillus apiarius]MCY9515969.1 bifunctional metallophosphatase/5'-nucleotidase [Paenibacillus apiarius]MCY9520879.1 bifunctional metallophosphatase/5'-nucleotidase [Paenibacillus apiarius]MCY9553584.1 bifunctional metallophosphatase/5'-nucleotidase [Paenibacillus apiarius]MCY9557893.1 bifunctional metallophosphatase/5'-nucleotidase [Paenibacillus apiarius]MCY9685748.1 bifunctional metallophosphatase/5'-nucleotidase [Paenibacillus apiari
MCETFTLTIWATSDVHGHMLPIRYADNAPAELGLLKLASRIRQARADKQHFLLIDNGDLLQGTPLASYHARLDLQSPNPMIAALNRLKYDTFIPGNHEFNFGLEFVRKAQRESAFPWLAANIVREETGMPYFGAPYFITDFAGGLRAAVLGLTTRFIPHWELPEHIAGLRFLPAVEAAKQWVPELRIRKGADVVIIAYHGGLERDIHTGSPLEEDTGENEGSRICAEVEGIDVLITGHQHRTIAGERIGDTIVVQPGSQGRYAAEVELVLARQDGRWRISEKRAQLIAAAGVEPDRELSEWIAPYEANTQRWLDRPICLIDGDMRICDPHEARLAEHPLIEFINRVQMDVSGADISCTALFDDSAAGFGNQVSMREITAFCPFSNTLKVLRLKGRDIRDALEWNARYFALYDGQAVAVHPTFLYPKAQHYNYDMWEGIEYVMNVSRPAGERIVQLTRNGQPLEPDKEYDVAMNHYRASGAGGFRMFAGKPVIRDIPIDIAELIASYMMKQGTITAAVNHNWKVIWD